jgi:dUTP pyrophosphatase
MYTDTGKSFNTGYYMHPRSSLSKTQLRLANSTGIIDAGYRGHLMGMFDVVNIQPNSSDDNDCDFYGHKFDRYLQICAPGLVPILVEIVHNINELGGETERGSGGFGSTGI